jgi:hypothetical protein
VKKNKNESLSRRISRVLSELVSHRQKKAERRESRKDFRHMTRPMRRKQTPALEKVVSRLTKIIAYDLETTRIKKGTPRPLYITACGPEGFWISGEVLGVSHLSEILVTRFLIPETQGARFVAWNGNKFDVYFVALALLKNPDYILRPYLTSGKNLRGLRIVKRVYSDDGIEITGQKGAPRIDWEFLDGIAVTGIQKSLSGFLKTFAPAFQKLDGPDFDKEDFNPRNAAHVKYAERDSEGLYHALEKARMVCVENFSIDLSATIGNMAIKIFQRHIPNFVECWKPPAKALRVIHDQVMRGGFCFCVKRYRGPVWKYDLNQAYAAAMRDARMPAGRCVWSQKINPYAVAYIARLTARNFANRIPFYYRDIETGKSVFALQEIGDTWLTSIEIEQLKAEGWKVDVAECWFWESKFSMKEYVNKLENLRIGGGRDPKDAQGEMMKYIGNNSYGKTVERLDGLELIMSAEQPDGFSAYPVDDIDDDSLNYVWYKFAAPVLREYHQPQLGAFITAYVRMVVRRAALLNPDTWLYADTDCVVFRDPVALTLDPGKYGAWKIEESGTVYTIAAKKVYCSFDGKTKHAKGLNIKYLTTEDFEKWYQGIPPKQTQIQRQNFVKVVSGFDMFFELPKWGEVNAHTRATDLKEKAS